MNTHVCIILAEGFEEIEAITPIDLLRRVGITVTIIGLDNRAVTGSHGITVTTDVLLSEYTVLPDAIILPGGQPGTTNLIKDNRVLELVKKCFADFKLCAAICAAPIVFARAGILGNKKVTCFPGNETKLEGGIYAGDKVVIDTNIITSKGAGTAIDFSLSIIGYLKGKDTSEALGRTIQYKG